ncbi:GTP 3',8-cyclase MoaA [Anaeromyxobacter diazotrophicus]|uniref:GTP 3',8-cyclase n=1 Tax=Anaeromyxobacter diazotrophicus TaxID=2590199 RepID=A0A7I9VRH7_9BACT|nr:GTP 3',8-cyclase MoaA [Anaeromyxobacter diazotrophicus]GEJ59023.1 GTP 3',8-cyclase 1 [Anaeromyxobacter diazotrophicus]
MKSTPETLSIPPLQDAQGRLIAYLRLSLTDRCNFRCNYCSPSEYEEPSSVLTRPELARLVGVFARLGVRRVRLTGGEPTLRKDLVAIAGDVGATLGVEEVALTTNGHRLAELARPLRAAGVGALNVSLDTLRPERLGAISGRGARLADVLAGVDAAAAEGFPHLKLNTVVLGGVNEDELGDLVRYAWARGASPRFIELMPFAQGTPVPTARVKALLAAQGVALEPCEKRGWGPAHYMRERGAGAAARHVGFIGAMTENFCERCNRARVAADGGFQVCLGGEAQVPLGALLRGGASDEALEVSIRQALAHKAPRHHMEEASAGLVKLRPMMGIGG